MKILHCQMDCLHLMRLTYMDLYHLLVSLNLTLQNNLSYLYKVFLEKFIAMNIILMLQHVNSMKIWRLRCSATLQPTQSLTIYFFQKILQFACVKLILS